MTAQSRMYVEEEGLDKEEEELARTGTIGPAVVPCEDHLGCTVPCEAHLGSA